MSEENTQQLLIDSQESPSQGDYYPKRKVQHLESPESPQPSDVDKIYGASSTQIVSPLEENMETSQGGPTPDASSQGRPTPDAASQGRPTPDAADVVNDADDTKRFEQQTIIVTSKEKNDKTKDEYINAFLEMCKKLETLDA